MKEYVEVFVMGMVGEDETNNPTPRLATTHVDEWVG